MSRDGWPVGLVEVGSDPLVRDVTIGVIRQVGLVERDGSVVSMHRLVQEAIRAQLTPEQRDEWAERLLGVLVESLPDPEDHTGWDEFELLVPHVVAVVEHQTRPVAAAGDLLNQIGLQRALTILEDSYGPDHPDVAVTLGNLGNVYQERGDLDLAGTTLQRALTILEESYGPDHPDVEWIRGLVEDLVEGA